MVLRVVAGQAAREIPGGLRPLRGFVFCGVRYMYGVQGMHGTGFLRIRTSYLPGGPQLNPCTARCDRPHQPLPGRLALVNTTLGHFFVPTRNRLRGGSRSAGSVLTPVPYVSEPPAPANILRFASNSRRT
jgi:hypothetical protein